LQLSTWMSGTCRRLPALFEWPGKCQSFPHIRRAEPLALRILIPVPSRTLKGLEVMSKQNISSTLIATWVAVLSIVLFLVATPLRAQYNPSNYTFLVASGFLCGSAACPAAARSANDETYELTGAGTFDVQTKSVTAAGTFAHKSSQGTVLETGVWTTTQLVSFDSYGYAPGALRQLGIVPGLQTDSPRLMPMAITAMPAGGLAVFRIRLLPLSGPQLNAVLEVNCALGNVPRERSVEGIRLTLERSNSEYSEEINGRVMFLSMRPGMSTPAKAPQEEKAPETPEQPHN